MGLAQNGVAVPSGNPLAIQGVLPAGVAIRGETVWLAPVEQTWQTILQINCGGAAIAGTSWLADQFYSGGTTYSTTNAIDTSQVTNPAPQAVYQIERVGLGTGASAVFTYTIPNLTASQSYKLRLHFCELSGSPGIRVFNVLVNGAVVISQLDLSASVGNFIAYIFENVFAANALGQIVISFSVPGGTYGAILSGIEILEKV